MNPRLDDIQDWKQFEDLVKLYFEGIEDEDNNVIKTLAKPSGEGADGGRDILVIFTCSDSIHQYERTWVVQCKFYTASVSPSDLANTNIPGLIHQYNADGYLLVCKNSITAGTSEMFENWQKNCKFGYQYEFWQGNDFINKLMNREKLLQQFFPKYWNFIKGL